MKKLIIYLGCMLICYTNQSCAVLEVLPDVLDPCGSFETQLTLVEATSGRIGRGNVSKADCELIKVQWKKLNDLAQACTDVNIVSTKDKQTIKDGLAQINGYDCSGLSIFLQNNDFLNQ